jgi:hypothetical protein
MISASSADDTFQPSFFQLSCQFWQYRQRMLHPSKKIVPDPKRPLSGASSPKCAP